MHRLQEYALSALKLHLSADQINTFTAYENELMNWNEKMNLTAIRSHDEIIFKHFIDSLSCLEVMHMPTPGKVIDVGTGAGFPGLVLKIALPSIRLVLVESIGKKAAFCQHIAKTLHLEHVTVIQARAEEVGADTQYREKFDWAIARAVASMPVLAEYLLPLTRINGCMLAQKGENGPLETQQAATAFRKLGGKLRKVHPVTLPGIAEQRYLIVVEKKHATPDSYPRRTGTPAKKPIL